MISEWFLYVGQSSIIKKILPIIPTMDRALEILNF